MARGSAAVVRGTSAVARGGPAVARGASTLARGTLTLLGVLIVLFALLTLGARVGLPFVASYKPDIERALGDYLGQPVTIDSLALTWQASGPVLDASGLALGHAARQRVSVERALIDLDVFASGWRRRPVLNELTLVGADLLLERATDGSVELLGLGRRTAPVPGHEGGTPLLETLGWLFDAKRVGIVDARLDVRDLEHEQGYRFEAVDLSVENSGGDHRLRMALDLPDRLGGRIDVGIDLEGDLREAIEQDAIGQFHLRSDRLELGALAGLVDLAAPSGGMALAPRVPEASVSLELWGQLDGATVSQARGRIEATSGSQLDGAPIVLSTAVAFLQKGGEWQLSADGADLRADATHLTARTLSLRSDGQGVRLVTAGEGSDRSLELLTALGTRHLGTTAAAAGSPAAAAVPNAFDPVGWLASARPTGRVDTWQLSLTHGPALAEPLLEGGVQLRSLSLAAADGVPGVRGADARIGWQARAGRIEVTPTGSGSDTAGLTLDMPAFYSAPLRLDELDLELDVSARADRPWRIDGPIRLASGSLEAAARIAVTLERGRSPLVDLRGDMALGDARELATLMPDALLPNAAMRWFRDAFTDGAARDGKLLWYGRLDEFPYASGEGVFRADLDMVDVTMDWSDGWPVARSLNGRLAFDGVSFEARPSGGQLDRLAIGRTAITIPDLRVPHLQVVASGQADVPALLDFATEGPLASVLGPAFERVSGSGAATVDVDVRVPLSRRAEALHGPLAVDGSVFLRDNRLSFEQADIDLASVTGGIGFDEAGARARSVRADWLGQPIRIDVDTAGNGASRALTVGMSGDLDGGDVLAHYGLPLDRWARGRSRWSGQLTVPFDTASLARNGIRLDLESELVGTALLLPAPFAKSSGRVARMSVSSAFRPDEPDIRWQVRHGNADTRLEVLADTDADGLQALAIGLGGTPANPTGTPGIRLDGTLGRLDADGWIETLASLIEDIDAASADEAATAEPLLPISGGIDIAAVSLRQAPIGAARLRLNSAGDYLNASIDNAHLRGNVRYPRRRSAGDSAGADALPMRVRLARVDEVLIDALRGADLVDDTPSTEPVGGPDPRTLPPIEARIERLEYHDLDLQGLTMRTRPALAGLDIVALGFTHDRLQLLGEGRWHLADPLGFDARRTGDHVTELALTVQSSDFGRGLDGIGLDGLLAAASGRATASLGWPGPLWSPDVATLDGSLDIALERGRIVPLEPGAGKLIGLFALQALPRRLSLDFTDLQDGLAFNTLDGRAALDAGVLETSLLQLRGPIGVIDVVGRTDLDARTLDQQVTVLPRVSAALPIIGAISGGASAGITVLLAGGLLKAMGVDFDRIGLREYRLTGPWAEPSFEPLRRTR